MEGKTVDLSALSERELLILLTHKVDKIEKEIGRFDRDVVEIKLELAQMKIQMRIWASLAGIIGGGVIAFIVNVLNNN